MPEICKIINNKKLYIRHCPKCQKQITYTFATAFYKARKRNFSCKKCSNSNPTRKIKISDSMKGIKRSEETKKKMSIAKKGNNYWNGKKHSNETIKKMRISAIKRIEKNINNQLYPNFNPKACKIIDEYANKNKYNFQHAMNGGEFYIKELGYWVDGYDKEKNIVIEIDEKRHFNKNGNLKKKDINRQREIEKFLKCEFIRISY